MTGGEAMKRRDFMMGSSGCAPARLRALLAAGFWLVGSAAGAQGIDTRRFIDLSKTCQAAAAAPASPRAVKIRDVALAQHQSFRGSRIDNAGRIVFSGQSEAESDQESVRDVTPQQVPWQRVLRFWEDLQGNKLAGSPHWALEVWFYPGITSSDPPSQVSRKRTSLEALLRAIDKLDFSSLGEDAAMVKAALQQSAIRASVSDVAWSAAFVGSVMRSAGLAPSAFAYNPLSVRYIVASIKQSLAELDGQQGDHFFRACDPDLTKPRVGDLYCFHRHVDGAKDAYKPKPGMSLFRSLFRELVNDPSVINRSHCDIVVRVDDAAKKVVVVGGNVQNSVTERMLNLNRQGVLSANQGAPCAADTAKAGEETTSCNLNSQKWFVLLQAR
jgi:hypothetical protein